MVITATPQANSWDNWTQAHTTLEKLRCHDHERLQHLDYADRPTLKQFQRQDGEIEIALIRREHHAAKADRRWSKSQKLWVEIGVVVVGALTFSTVPQLLGNATNRGPLAQTSGFVGGAAIAWLTHNRAVKGLGQLRRRQDAQAALQDIVRAQRDFPVRNELVEHYFQSQTQVVRQVEADNLKADFKADIWSAMVASAFEGGAAFLLTINAGVMLACLAGGFPVLIIWLAALFQSEAVDLAESSAVLEQAYEALIPVEDLSETEAMKVYVLDAAVNYLTEANSSAVKTLAGARAKATAEFCQQYLDVMNTEAIGQVEERLMQHREAKADLVQQFPEPELEQFDWAGYRADQVSPQFVAAKQRWQARIDQEEQKLERELEEDLSILRGRWGLKMQPWQQLKLKAEADFQDAERG